MSAKQNLIDAIDGDIISADAAQVVPIGTSGLFCVRLRNSDEIAIADDGGFWTVNRNDLIAIVEATK